MKHTLKPVPFRALQWHRHGDSKRVSRLTAGINQIPPCTLCGNPTEDHGWIDGVGIVHPGDWIADIASQTIILRDATMQEIREAVE